MRIPVIGTGCVGLVTGSVHHGSGSAPSVERDKRDILEPRLPRAAGFEYVGIGHA